jgi:hypothetical protein
MKSFFLCLFLSAFIPNLCFSDENPNAAATRSWQPYLSAGTDFPLMIDGGAGIRFSENWSFDISYGTMPKGYARTIGGAIDHFSGTNGYDDLLANGTTSNHLWRFAASYHFTGRRGWSARLRFFTLSSNGTEGITDVETLTGTTFPVLKAILAAQGRSITFASEFSLSAFELGGGYTWGITPHLFFESSFGVAKVISSDVRLSSSAPNFDASQAGKNAYSDAQVSLKDALSKYGYSPILGLNFIYEF